MIEINLLPGSGKKKASKRQSVDIKALLAGLNARAKDKFLIAAIASSIVAALAIGLLYTTQAAREAKLTAELDKATKDSVRYAAVVRDRVRAESIRDTLLRQVNLIKSIDEDRYIWPHIMDELTRALPQYTWLMNVSYAGVPQGANNVVALPKVSKEDSIKAAKSGKPVKLPTEVPRDVIGVVLRGQTVDIQALTRYMKELEASPFLGNVTLERSELATGAGGKEVTQFQLTLGYTRPDTLSIRRAPMSLASGGR
jgi:Tfp pilus assembly protein PilN